MLTRQFGKPGFHLHCRAAEGMAKAKVDAKQVGFKINSSETSKTGDSEVFTLAAPWTVKEADALSINYDAVVSAVSQPVTGQEIMSVVFVLEWA